VPEIQVAELRKKLRLALSEDANFRTLTNSKKQELNESTGMLTHFAALEFEVIAKSATGEA
jgi:predicted mannosyl-3-phosphoglycerate phosphatase (HAD superfamily)